MRTRNLRQTTNTLLSLALACASGCGSDAENSDPSGAGTGANAGSSGVTGMASAGRGSAGLGSTAAGSGGAALSPPIAGTAAAVSGSVAPPPLPPPAGGSAGAAVGGGAGMAAPGAQPAPMNPPEPSAGCNQAEWPPAGTLTIDVDGMPREYVTKLPASYDPAKPYRLVFGWHGLGGSAMQVAGGFGGGYYGLATAARWADEAIFIAGQGLATTGADGEMGGAGWPNTGGRDVAFVRKLVEWATTKYCIDQSRVFSTGMSYGGIMSNTLGCQMGDVFRAIAPMAGSGPRQFGGGACVGQVAAWLSHGRMDEVVSFASGQASRDSWVMSNHCTTQTAPVAPDGCVSYEGCDAGHPVHWCEFDGGHTIPMFASAAIFDFFSQF